jgi:hypothetical protein
MPWLACLGKGCACKLSVEACEGVRVPLQVVGWGVNEDGLK